MSIEHDVQPVHAKNKKSKTDSTYDENVGEGDIDSAFQFFCSCVAQDATMQHVSKLRLLHNFVTVKDGLVSLKQTV